MKMGMTLNTATDWRQDGKLVGARARTYDSASLTETIPAVLPDNGQPVRESVYMVNGIMTDVELQASDLQRLANTGRSVIGIHNATKGIALDLAQCVGDKLDLEAANNHAVDTSARVIEEACADGKSGHLVGHSQGALVLSCAVARVRTKWIQQGQSEEAVNQRLHDHITITSMGGAAYSYPPGPRYDHHINWFDPVPMMTGVGATASEDVYHFAQVNRPTNMPAVSSGVSNYFARLVDRSLHGPQDVYIPQWER